MANFSIHGKPSSQESGSRTQDFKLSDIAGGVHESADSEDEVFSFCDMIYVESRPIETDKSKTSSGPYLDPKEFNHTIEDEDASHQNNQLEPARELTQSLSTGFARSEEHGIFNHTKPECGLRRDEACNLEHADTEGIANLDPNQLKNNTPNTYCLQTACLR